LGAPHHRRKGVALGGVKLGAKDLCGGDDWVPGKKILMEEKANLISGRGSEQKNGEKGERLGANEKKDPM